MKEQIKYMRIVMVEIFQLADVEVFADAPEYLFCLNQYLRENQERLAEREPLEYLLKYFQKYHS